MTELRFVPSREFERAWKEGSGTKQERAQLFADLARINALSMIMEAGSGHVGSSFSSLDIVSWIYLCELGVYDTAVDGALRGVYLSSKGHDAPGLYAVLTATGRLDPSLLHRLRRLGGLPGHPDVRTPWIEANTGSLGMGVSKAKGIAEGDRLEGVRRPIFVLTGDGELQEGQIWESLPGAVNRGLDQITIIVDHNKIQSDTWVDRVSHLGDIEAKFAAFGWAVARCNGHDLGALSTALSRLRDDDRPGALIADTVKGRGVSFMEHFAEDGQLYPYHSGAPSPEEYALAIDELLARSQERADDLGLDAIETTAHTTTRERQDRKQSTVDAWSGALVSAAENDSRIIALDADLVLDTGLLPFSQRFPDRFIEAGIAEQDMVSMAGGLALRGYIPVVHSFASFLSGRPHEQVLVNATEGTKIVYAGALSGLLPAGPGHSHQAVTDVASFAMVPGLLVVEPSHIDEVPQLLDVCLHDHPGSFYARLTSVAVELPFDWPDDRPTIGRGTQLRSGRAATLVVSGPVLLREAWLAAEDLAAAGVEVGLFAMPWLNTVDDTWWRDVLATSPALLVAENHVPQGGVGQFLLARSALLGWTGHVSSLAVTRVPECGSDDEVLRVHRLDAASLTNEVRSLVGRAAG